jgi:predicted  nucleic acid-binding Zn-ribbon protein
VNSDLQALLELQEDDAALDALEVRLATLNARTATLAKERSAADAALSKVREQIAGEEKNQRAIQTRMAEHKQTQQHNTAQLDVVTKPKEAAAAMAQIEHARRLIGEDENDLKAIDGRLREIRDRVAEREMALEEMNAAQTAEKEKLEAERAELTQQIASAKSARAAAAAKVPRNLTSNYDRLRSRKRDRAVFPLSGNSCGNCDTMLATQGRAAMSKGGIAVCEGCGVMLYAEN